MIVRVFLTGFLLTSSVIGSAVEPITVRDLARSFTASRAMERGDPASADATVSYRAGRFDGYLISLGELMQARGELCLPACFCHVREQFDPALEKLLGDPALDLSQPAHPWLADQLRAMYPCTPR